MAVFPLFIDMNNRKVIVVGGGSVALRKVRMLLGFGADIQIFSQKFHGELLALWRQGRITCEKVTWKAEGITVPEDAFMVIAATSDRALNEKIAGYCQERNIWVDCSDSAGRSNCLFPAIVKRGEIVIGISTSGGVPALARHLREKIEQTVPEWYGSLERKMRVTRLALKQQPLSPDEKRQYLANMIRDAEREKRE